MNRQYRHVKSFQSFQNFKSLRSLQSDGLRFRQYRQGVQKSEGSVMLTKKRCYEYFVRVLLSIPMGPHWGIDKGALVTLKNGQK
jgi:hypothetical protein